LRRYFDVVYDMIKKDYASLFISVGEAIKIQKEDRLMEKKHNSFGLLDSYLDVTDFSKVISDFLQIRKLFSIINLEKLFIYENINYFNIIHRDWKFFSNVILFKILIIEKKFFNFFKINSKIKEIIYLMEYQPWEFALNKICSKLNIKTKGVLHSVFRPNLMNFYYPKIVHSMLFKPSMVGVNDNAAKSRLYYNGFKSSQLLKIEAQRYNYLNNYKAKLNNKSQKKKTILIITSIDKVETKKMLELFVLSNVSFAKIYIKEHPQMPVDPIIKSLNKKFPSHKIIKTSILKAFDYSENVYVANSSSALLESVILAKNTVSLITLSTLPLPAIDKAPNLHFVYNEYLLSKTLRLFKSKIRYNLINQKKNERLYLSKKMSLWTKFIKR